MSAPDDAPAALRARRAAERDAREWQELADLIEGVWRGRFGEPTPVAKADIAEIRRRGS